MDGTDHGEMSTGIESLLAELGDGGRETRFDLRLGLLLKALDHRPTVSVADIREQLQKALHYLRQFDALGDILSILRSPARDDSHDAEPRERVVLGWLFRGYYRSRRIPESVRKSILRSISVRHANATFCDSTPVLHNEILSLPAEEKKLLVLLKSTLDKCHALGAFREWETTRSGATLALPIPIEDDLNAFFERFIILRVFLDQERAPIQSPCAPSDTQESLFAFKKRVAKDELSKKGALR